MIILDSNMNGTAVAVLVDAHSSSMKLRRDNAYVTHENVWNKNVKYTSEAHFAKTAKYKYWLSENAHVARQTGLRTLMIMNIDQTRRHWTASRVLMQYRTVSPDELQPELRRFFYNSLYGRVSVGARYHRGQTNQPIVTEGSPGSIPDKIGADSTCTCPSPSMHVCDSRM